MLDGGKVNTTIDYCLDYDEICNSTSISDCTWNKDVNSCVKKYNIETKCINSIADCMSQQCVPFKIISKNSDRK